MEDLRDSLRVEQEGKKVVRTDASCVSFHKGSQQGISQVSLRRCRPCRARMKMKGSGFELKRPSVFCVQKWGFAGCWVLRVLYSPVDPSSTDEFTADCADGRWGWIGSLGLRPGKMCLPPGL